MMFLPLELLLGVIVVPILERRTFQTIVGKPPLVTDTLRRAIDPIGVSPKILVLIEAVGVSISRRPLLLVGLLLGDRVGLGVIRLHRQVGGVAVAAQPAHVGHLPLERPLAPVAGAGPVGDALPTAEAAHRAALSDHRVVGAVVTFDGGVDAVLAHVVDMHPALAAQPLSLLAHVRPGGFAHGGVNVDQAGVVRELLQRVVAIGPQVPAQFDEADRIAPELSHLGVVVGGLKFKVGIAIRQASRSVGAVVRLALREVGGVVGIMLQVVGGLGVVGVHVVEGFVVGKMAPGLTRLQGARLGVLELGAITNVALVGSVAFGPLVAAMLVGVLVPVPMTLGVALKATCLGVSGVRVTSDPGILAWTDRAAKVLHPVTGRHMMMEAIRSRPGIPAVIALVVPATGQFLVVGAGERPLGQIAEVDAVVGERVLVVDVLGATR